MLLYGIHDQEGAALVPPGGWDVALVALSFNPPPADYNTVRSDINWLVRVNWAYGPTIPLNPQDEQLYFDRLSNFVHNSRGVHTYIIGNEPNHENEGSISPERYAQFFIRAAKLIRTINMESRIAPAGVAPYTENVMPWTQYLNRMLDECSKGYMPDSLVCHAYVRGSEPADIYSTAEMGGSLAGTYNGFYTYRDFCENIPDHLLHLPIDLTEFDENLPDGWVNANTGVVQAAYKEIDWWNNQPGTPKFRSMSMYRYPKYDKWYFQDKNGVIEDFREAVALGLRSPTFDKPVKTQLPTVKKEEQSVVDKPVFTRFVNENALKYGIRVDELQGTPGQWVWKVVRIQKLSEQDSGGRHHVYVEALDEHGYPLADVPFTIQAGDKVFERKTNGQIGFNAANYDMYPNRNGYNIHMPNGDSVIGVGIGDFTPDGGFNAGIHSATIVHYKKVMATGVSKPSEPSKITLVHPVSNPEYRRITQVFGVNEDYYKRFVVGGVPLRGHNGMDFGTPVGSQIVAVDAGRVAEVAFDPDGYGDYVKIIHSWGETLYAHLDESNVVVGEQVVKGEVIALSGNSGISSGPHLHFGMRVKPYNRSDGFGGYIDPLPYLRQIAPAPKEEIWSDYPYIIAVLTTVANESGLPYELLASLAWAESSFRPHLEDGLFQIGDMAWQDYAPAVGATNINNPLDNARVGAAYFKWLLSQVDDDIWKALYAWNWGIGNVLKGGEPPAITKTFANKVIHGRDLIKAIGA